tara:strand:+ start:77573 stop:78034 length:462 start_codon:yes stop_codon:yes gene_type:complete
MSNVEIDLLRKMPIFGGLKTCSLESLLDNACDVHVSRGHYFFREGEPGGALFVLREGAVEVLREWNGQTVTLGRLGQGDCFGEMALVDFRPRSASVRAVKDCHGMKLSLDALRSLYANDLEQYAMIMMNMGREVSRRLRTADDRILELQQSQS